MNRKQVYACVPRDRIGKIWEGLGSIGKRAKPAAAGRRSAPASYTLGNFCRPRTILPRFCGMSRHTNYRTSWRQCTQKLSTLPKPSQYFSQKPPSTAPPAYAAYSGIRYNIVRRTPACRAIELGRFGRAWEVLGVYSRLTRCPCKQRPGNFCRHAHYCNSLAARVVRKSP